MMTAMDIDSIAADWAARIDRGTLAADEDRALMQWIESDSRHRGAFMRMRAIALHSERARALGPAFDPDRFTAGEYQSPLRSRGRRWRGAWNGRAKVLAVAAAACAAVLVALPLIDGTRHYDTRQGEFKVVSLADGTVMTLNTASNVEVDYTDTRRRIRLLEGEVLFDVVKDRTRPFIVAAGGASVRAIGTTFAVRRLKDKPLHVIVREGAVEVQQNSLLAPVRVTANMQAELPIQSGVDVEPQAVEPDEVNRKLAWQDGRIAFEAETLAGAAEAFGRYSQTAIVIDDPAVAGRQITGLFSANDPISFARAAAKTLGLNAEVRAGAVHLTQ